MVGLFGASVVQASLGQKERESKRDCRGVGVRQRRADEWEGRNVLWLLRVFGMGDVGGIVLAGCHGSGVVNSKIECTSR